MKTITWTATDELGGIFTAQTAVRDATTWRPINWRAQIDHFAAQAQSMGLTPWAVDPEGAFSSYEALPNGHSIQPQPDGSMILEVHSGGIDHPGTAPQSGGDRAGLDINTAGIATPSGPAGTELVGVNGRELWYRLDLGFPSGLNILPLKYHQNASEWHGKAAGASVLKLGFNGAGDHIGITFTPLIMGVWGTQQWLKQIPIVLGERHVWDIGVLWTTNATGWVQVYLDNQLVASLSNVQTMKTFANGSTENVSYGCQLYRSKTDAAGNPLPPSQLQVWQLAIAGSLAAIEASP